MTQETRQRLAEHYKKIGRDNPFKKDLKEPVEEVVEEKPKKRGRKKLRF